MGSLESKVIVVTGASRGLGEAIAVGYAKEGASLVLAARTETDLERVAAECKEAGAASTTTVTTDITSERDVAALIERTTADHGRVDVFVANAGTSYSMLTNRRYAELATYDLEIAKQIFDVNLFGTWLCMKAAFPVMTEGSSFIVIGSETGRALRAGSGFYALSKAAEEALATMASRENKEKGIRVNVLSPGGMVDTQLFGPSGMPEFLKDMHPPLAADIIVEPAVFLASDASVDVTGAFMSGRDVQARGMAAVAAEASKQ